MRLADEAGLTALAQHRMTVAGDKGVHAGAKITTLITGMAAGVDSLTVPETDIKRLLRAHR